MNKQEKRKQKAINILKSGGTDRELAIFEHVNDLEDKFDETVEKLPDLNIVLASIKGKDADEAKIIDEITRQLPPPEKGDSYVLTPEDKQEIAGLITVPIVEKEVRVITEKTEVIKEQPIVTQQITNEIKEVAVTENPEQIVEKVNNSKILIEPTQVKGLNDIREMAIANSVPVTTSFFNGLRAKNLNISGGTATQNGDTVTVTVSGGGGSALTITEQDGSPSVANVSTIKFSNGTVTDNGGGTVSVTNTGGGSTLTTTTTLYLDVNRVDAYTEDGTINTPFKSLSAAISYVNTFLVSAPTAQFCFEMSPGSYVETGNITLPNTTMFVNGRGAAIVPNAVSGTSGIIVQNTADITGITVIGNLTVSGASFAQEINLFESNIFGNFTANTNSFVNVNNSNIAGTGSANSLITISAGSQVFMEGVTLGINTTNYYARIANSGTLYLITSGLFAKDNSNYAITNTAAGSTIRLIAISLFNFGTGGGVNVSNGSTTNLDNVISNVSILVNGSTNGITAGTALVTLDAYQIENINNGTYFLATGSNINSSFYGNIVTPEIDFAATNGNFVKLKAPASPSNWSFTLPTSAGTAGQTMITDGSGNGSWANTTDLLTNPITGAATALISNLNVCTGTSADYAVTLPTKSGNSGKQLAMLMGSTINLTKLVTVSVGTDATTKTGTVTGGTTSGTLGTGTLSISAASTTVTGSSTSFTTQLRIGDTININIGNSGLKRITAIANNTSLTIDSVPGVTLSGISFYYTQTGITGSSTLFSTEYSVGDGITVGGVTRPILYIYSNTALGIDIPFLTAPSASAHGKSTDTIDGNYYRIMWATEVANLYTNGSNWFKISGKSVAMSAGLSLVASGAILPNGTFTQIPLDNSESNNTGLMTDTTNHRVLIKRTSDYILIGVIGFGGDGTGGAGLPSNVPLALTNVARNAFPGTTNLQGESIFSGTAASYVTSAFTSKVPLAYGDFLILTALVQTSSIYYYNGAFGAAIRIVEIPNW